MALRVGPRAWLSLMGMPERIRERLRMRVIGKDLRVFRQVLARISGNFRFSCVLDLAQLELRGTIMVTFQTKQRGVVCATTRVICDLAKKPVPAKKQGFLLLCA